MPEPATHVSRAWKWEIVSLSLGSLAGLRCFWDSGVLVNWMWYAPDFWCCPVSRAWVTRIRVMITNGAGRLEPSWQDVISLKHRCPGQRVILGVSLPLSLRKVSQHVCVSGFAVGQSASPRACVCVHECSLWVQSFVVCVCICEWQVLAFFRFCVLDFPLKYLVLLVSHSTWF